jgi:septal ring factor EnvC (AmiA/AmiB activator)
MSEIPTPRTDEVLKYASAVEYSHGKMITKLTVLSHQLERELATANARIAEYKVQLAMAHSDNAVYNHDLERARQQTAELQGQVSAMRNHMNCKHYHQYMTDKMPKQCKVCSEDYSNWEAK